MSLPPNFSNLSQAERDAYFSESARIYRVQNSSEPPGSFSLVGSRKSGGPLGQINVEPPAAAPPEVALINAASVTMTAIRWLWGGYLARGKFHVLGGAPGCGKTTIVLALITVVTRGGRFPDGSSCGSPGNAVIWSGEDDPADTLAPRLAAAGADMRRVFFVGDVREGGKARSFDPAKDSAALRDAITNAGGASLLMVDPIVSAVAGDSHKNAEVRRALQPLADLAAEVGAALIGITHFTKGTAGRDPTERITGSLAFGALARIVMVAAKVESKDGDASKRIFARAKSNIGRDDGGFEYDIEQIAVPDHDGLFASVVRWGAPIEGSARDILAEVEDEGARAEGHGGEASDFLDAQLAEGAKPVPELRRAAEAHRIAWRTIERAKQRRADIVAERSGFGRGGGWTWRLAGLYTANTPEQENVAVFGGESHTPPTEENSDHTPPKTATFSCSEPVAVYDDDGGVEI